MTAKELRKSWEWAKKQRKKVNFEVEDRQPNEGSATKKQLDYIRSMLRDVDESKLNSLGKWQASSLIDQIKVEKEIFTKEKVEEYRNRHRFVAVFIFLIVAAIIIFIARR